MKGPSYRFPADRDDRAAVASGCAGALGRWRGQRLMKHEFPITMHHTSVGRCVIRKLHPLVANGVAQVAVACGGPTTGIKSRGAAPRKGLGKTLVANRKLPKTFGCWKPNSVWTCPS